jgi:hypothetical protein
MAVIKVGDTFADFSLKSHTEATMRPEPCPDIDLYR